MRTTRTSLGGRAWSVLPTLPSEWRLRDLGTVDLAAVWPPQGPWYPATVPGDVQSDLVDAGVLPDPRIGLDSRAGEWTSARDWLYRREFTLEVPSGATVELVLEGVDERCAVFVDGTAVGEHAGFAEATVLDVTAALRPGLVHEVRILVEHAPMPPHAWGCAGWTSRVRAWKPRLSYGWDFAPRLIPVGLWGDVVLVVSQGGRLDDVHVRAAADGALDVAVEATGGATVEVALASPDGSVLALPPVPVVDGRAHVSAQVLEVALWWPAGDGEPVLHTVTTTLRDLVGEVLDVDARRTGFRTVRLVPAPDAPPDALPYVVEVNGRAVQVRGWNWVPVDVLYGRAHEDRYAALLDLASDAHVNLLRVWGGGLPERHAFYDRCDELGILVWQDFLLSSSGIQNSPPVDDEHLALCRRAAAAMVRGRRSHPSLALWCAGNELYADDYRPEPPGHPVVAELARVVAELDGDRPYVPGTPTGPQAFARPEHDDDHDVHGPWAHQGVAEHYAFHDRLRPLLHSEFGTSGATNLPSLLRLAGDVDPWPPDGGNELWVHHGSWWLDLDLVRSAFGQPSGLEQYVAASQLLQADGLRYAVDAGRRRWPRQAGTLPWQLDEPWPMAACSTAVDHWGHPKPAYWAVRDAYAPDWLGVRLESPLARPGERVALEVWAATAPAAGDTSWSWSLHDLRDGAVLGSGEGTGPVSRDPSLVGTAGVDLPDREGAWLLRVVLGDGLALRELVLSTREAAPLRPLLELPPASLRVDAVDDLAAPGLEVGYRLALLPGEAVPLRARRPSPVTVGAGNAPAVTAVPEPR